MTATTDIAATAACGAYLLAAIADARIETVEEARFFGGIVNDPAFRAIDAAALTAEYARLHAALRADYASAEAEILAAVGAVRGAPAAEAVKLAARHAVVADQKLKPQEETVLARIACALGIDPEAL
ncbi:MAG: TerB family tellurite resistance protein [Parvularculaceae bacterium]